MKKELIIELFEKFEAACFLIEETGVGVRGSCKPYLVMPSGTYFLKAIEKAKNACEGAGETHSRPFCRRREHGRGYTAAALNAVLTTWH
jgi:DNA-damage-inducible protein D